MSQQRDRPTMFLFRRLLCGCCDKDRVVVRSIDLSHSLLSEVPPEVYMCERTLEFLCLDSNHVVELPRQLFNCDELRVLSVSDNELNFIPPAISFLQNLQRFDISKNAVTTLPENIRQCSSLIYLDVSINPLEKLPEGLVNIVSLQELYLTDVYLEFLPANFGKLVNLRILELRENSLVTLPKTMNRLIHLTRLDIGFNEFHELPEVVSSLHNLTELWIDGNHIKKLSHSIGQLRKMIHFDSSHNNLENLPRDVGYWTRVQEFNISNNELSNLPSTIGNMKNLVGLRLEENSLKALPDTIGKLTHLEELMLTHNYLSHLPGSIGLLRRLRILTVDKNYLSDIPPELGSCTSLSILSMRANRLSEIPAEIGHLSNLRVLNLVDNLMRYLPISILKLEKLGALWLSNNQSQPLMPLQQELNRDTMTNVLTCFMLPQQRAQPEPGPSREPDEQRPRVAPRHIYFAPNTGIPLEQPGRLTRAPTPYPKELRALAKHAKHVQKNLSVSQHKPSEKVAHQGPHEIKEATVKVKPGTLSSLTMSTDSTPRSIDTLTEPLVSPLVQTETTETERTTDSSVSSLPVAYESSPIIREAKNIRTDSQAGPVVHSPTPQLITVVPAPSKETKVPPPYHIAAAYSVKAQFFNPTEYTLPESTSTSHSACSPAFSIGDRSDQQRGATYRVASPSLSAGERSEQQSTRTPYVGRASFPYLSERSEAQLTASPEMCTSKQNEPQNTLRISRRSAVSPIMTSDDSSEQPNTHSLSHFVVKTPVLDSNKYSVDRGSNQPTPSVGEPASTLGAFAIRSQYSSSEGRGTSSPVPDAGERIEQQSTRSLGDYVLKPPVHEIDKYAIRIPGDVDPDVQISVRSLSEYAIRTPHNRSSVHAIDKYTIPQNRDANQSSVERCLTAYTIRSTITDSTQYAESDGGSAAATTGLSEPDSAPSSGALSPGELRIPQTYSVGSSGTISPGEIRVLRSTHSLDVYPGRSIGTSFSHGVPLSTHSLGTYTLQGRSNEDISDSTRSGGSYTSGGLTCLNLDEFVSVSAAATATVTGSLSQETSFTAVSSYETSDSSSEPTSRLSFQLLTPPVPQPVNSSYLLSTIAEHSGSQTGSDPIARSVECDMAVSEGSDPASTHSLLGFTLGTPHAQLPDNGTSMHSGLQSIYSSTVCSTHMSPDPTEYSLPDSRSASQSTHSLQSTILPLSAHSIQSPHQLPSANSDLSEHSVHSTHSVLSDQSAHMIQSTHSALSGHSAQSIHSTQLTQTDRSGQSVHSSQSFAFLPQSPNLTLSTRSGQSMVLSPQSIHSTQSPHLDQSARSGQSVHSTQSLDLSAQSIHSTQSPHLTLSARSGQSVYSTQSFALSPQLIHSIQSLPLSAQSSHLDQSPHLALSARSGQSIHSTRSVILPPQSVHSTQSMAFSPQSIHSSQSSHLDQSPHLNLSARLGQSVHSTQSIHSAQSLALSAQSPHLSLLGHPSQLILSTHSPHLALSEHSDQSSHSGLVHPNQTLHSSVSARSTQSVNSEQSIHSGQSVLSTYSPHLVLSARSGRSVYSTQSPHLALSTHSVYSPHSTQSVHSIQTPHSPYSVHSIQSVQSMQSPHSSQSVHSVHTPHSGLSVYTAHSSHPAHSVRSAHSTETVDQLAGEPSESMRVPNMNETYTRSVHPCSVLDNDNDNSASGDHENNFNTEDNKPRFFVQDKPVPGQNIVAPTPKRPNAGDKSSRIPYLTSPTMRRSPAFATPQASSTHFVSVITSPRSCRRDMSVREVKSDTSIVSGGSIMKKTKIPGPNSNSKPVSPECNRTKKWVFGQHKNATVMNVLIQKNPDLGFSIVEVPNKGLFIDDVKTQELLSVGDKILEVEGFDATILNRDEVMEILLAAGKNVCMMISHI